MEVDQLPAVEVEELPGDVAEIVSEVENPEDGFFGPDSMMWEMSQENMVFLAGVAPVLLQIAHPMIATAGVEHSDYDDDLQGRFEETFDLIDTIIFGDLDTALKATMYVRRTHREVVGELAEDVGRFEEGDEYYAMDPDLLLWVHATLIDQAIVGYETYVREITDEERQEFYEDSQIFGRLMGIPKEKYPETIEDFYDYYEEAIENELAIGETGEEVIENYFDALGGFAPVARFLGIGTMPDHARDLFEDFGLGTTPIKDFFFEVFAKGIRTLPLSLLPRKVRYREKYREFRLEAS